MIEIKKSVSETYHLRGGQLGWADITLGSKDNSIDIKSDWGSYSTAFNSTGNNFKQFLVDLIWIDLLNRFITQGLPRNEAQREWNALMGLFMRVWPEFIKELKRELKSHSQSVS